MNDAWKPSPEWAAKFGRSNIDWNNGIARYFEPNALPSTLPRQARWLNNETAALIEFAIVTREAGYPPEAVRNITGQIGRTILSGDWALIGGDGQFAEVISHEQLQTDFDAIVGPFKKMGRVQLIYIASIVAKAGPRQKTLGGWGSGAGELKKRRAKAKKRA